MKTIAIHQPNYLPWPGYFYKINQVDEFVILDHVDILSGGAGAITNRTRLKGPDGSVLLTVPVRNDHKKINEVVIDYSRNWPQKHLNSFISLYRKAPYFDQYFPDIQAILLNPPSLLSELNTTFIHQLCRWLDIATPIVLSSSLDHKDLHKSALLVRICRLRQAQRYLSGNGARKYNDEALFTEAGIRLSYSSFQPVPYPQRFGVFVPGLSVLDALFNMGSAAKNLIHG